MKGDVERFYDEFSRAFVRDYVHGNARVDRQLQFLEESLPRDARSVLVVGCGSGESARHVARRIAQRARVLAVDISGQNLRLARALHSHPRVEYRKLDVVAEPLEGEFDAVVLPDVYEHIPRAARGALHAKLRGVLGEGGRVLLTVPTAAKLRALADAGEALQIVDEEVTPGDLLRLADEVGATLTYLAFVSVWESNDYIHAMAERGAERVGPRDGSRLKRGRRRPLRALLRRSGLLPYLRARRLRRRLGLLAQEPGQA
ncbi:MAG: class I SAM-dependent methyltransferase [Planctomycetota bacterium]